jgi:hypothetical protein
MLMFKARRPAIRTLRGWAIAVLNEAGAIHECEEHGWMQDRADPHPCDRAFDIVRRDPPAGLSMEAATVAIEEVLDSIGDTCPECPTKDYTCRSESPLLWVRSCSGALRSLHHPRRTPVVALPVDEIQ